MYIQQEGSHFQCMRAGCGQEHLAGANELFEHCIATLGKRTVSGNMPAGDGFAHVIKFISEKRGFVEGDFTHGSL